MKRNFELSRIIILLILHATIFNTISFSANTGILDLTNEPVTNRIYIHQVSPPQLSNGSFSMNTIVYYHIKLYEGVHVNSTTMKIVNSSNIITIISSM